MKIFFCGGIKKTETQINTRGLVNFASLNRMDYMIMRVVKNQEIN